MGYDIPRLRPEKTLYGADPDTYILKEGPGQPNVETTVSYPNLGTGYRLFEPYKNTSTNITSPPPYLTRSVWRWPTAVADEPFIIPDTGHSWACYVDPSASLITARVIAVLKIVTPGGTWYTYGTDAPNTKTLSTAGTTFDGILFADSGMGDHVFPAGSEIAFYLVCQVTTGAVSLGGFEIALETQATYIDLGLISLRVSRTSSDLNPVSSQQARRATALGRNATDVQPESTDEARRITDVARHASVTEDPVVDVASRSIDWVQEASDSNPMAEDLSSRQAIFRRGPAVDAPEAQDDAFRTLSATRVALDTPPISDGAERLYTAGRTTRYAYQLGDDPLIDPQRSISGVVRDKAGQPFLGGAAVLLFRKDNNVSVAQTVSSTDDGSYSFLRNSYDPYEYYVAAWSQNNEGHPIQSVSERGLLPE